MPGADYLTDPADADLDVLLGGIESTRANTHIPVLVVAERIVEGLLSG